MTSKATKYFEYTSCVIYDNICSDYYIVYTMAMSTK